MPRLYVANINAKINEATFERYLQQAGLKYLSVRMPDPDRPDLQNRGFAFIAFETQADYDAAKTFLQGREFAGKLLRVDEARLHRPAPVKHDAMANVETRTVQLAPDYRAHAPTGADIADKGGAR